MPIQIRFEGDIAILSSVGSLMNDPRYVDAGRDVDELLAQGFRRFVVELRGLGSMSSPLLGLMMTLTRQIRRHGGEVVLAGVGRSLETYLDEMRMEEFWDVFRTVDEAKGHFAGPEAAQRRRPSTGRESVEKPRETADRRTRLR